MTSAFCVLLSAGHSLDSILDMTYDQIGFCARAITLNRVEMLNALLSPLAGASGKAKTKGGPKKAKSTEVPDLNAADTAKALAEEERKYAALRAMGIAVGPPTPR